jgi:competence protein ComEC
VAGRTGWIIWPLQALLQMRGRLSPWVPVFLGTGVGVWFALDVEPSVWAYSAAGSLTLFGGLGWWRGPDLWQPVAAMLFCFGLGFLAAGARAQIVAAPMLDRPYSGPVQGRIIEIDRSATDALRLTLDQVVMNLPPDRTPARVRISVPGDADQAGVAGADPGQVVLTTARLAAPAGPTEPGGFDFRRMAYFDGLGAVGYTRTPVVLWQEADPTAQSINRLRMYLSRAIMAELPGDAGAFASGAMTGDRSGISQATVEALRDSNLAHLLAISGMNMAFLTGFVFVVMRYGLALVPPLALRVNTKKLAAVVAFAVAFFYLLLSGANVATERAFVMVAVFLGAVLLDRRAITLRSVALAASLLLLWQPESLTEPGFQLSFAATVALIAAFGALDGQVMRERLPRWVLPVFTLVLSSVVAGLATAPFAAAHFNRFTDYGLVANLLTVPVMSVLMGAGATAALLAPFGLAAPALLLMELAARWILFVAHWIAGLEGSVTAIVAPGPWVLPWVAFGGCWLVLMAGRARFLAALPFAVAIWLWIAVERPPVLVSGDGALVGVLGPNGRALSKATGGGFSAQTWLENDGDLVSQTAAFARPGFEEANGVRWFTLPDKGGDLLRGVVLSGRTPDLAAACATADVVIWAGWAPGSATDDCPLIDQTLLDQTGAVAIWAQGGTVYVEPASRMARVWMGALTDRSKIGFNPAKRSFAINSFGSNPPDGPEP